MSDNWICVIPRDPYFVPSSQAIERAKLLMEEIAPEADQVSFEIATEVRFRDCGVNLESIRCPKCDGQVPSEWWSELMGEDWDAGFRLGAITLPCGHSVSSLNDLSYHFDQGFSRFILEAMNPNVGELAKSSITQLEDILGCSLKVIYQHI